MTFQDYSETEQNTHKLLSDNIYIYNQSQHPSSGSKGIACIALACINRNDDSDKKVVTELAEIFRHRSYQEIVACKKLNGRGK